LSEKGGLIEVLGRNYRQVIWIGVLILCFLPAFVPLGVPISIDKLTIKAYKCIEELEPGDLVLVSPDFTPGMWVEVGPAMNAIMQHLFMKKVRIIIVSFYIDGPVLAEKILREIDIGDAKYGVDYVNLGYLPGMETAMAAFVENPRRIEYDYYGTPVEELEIMKDVKSIEDFKLYIFACVTWPDPWIRQFSGKVPKIITVISPAAISLVMPYVSGGQLYSMLPGTKGGAEYETLMKRPGVATSIMDATSLCLTFVMLLVIVGNVSYWRKRLRGE